MFLIFFQVRKLVLDYLGVLGELIVSMSRCGFTRVKIHGNYRDVLRDISVSLLGRHLMIRQVHYSITLSLVLYNPFFTLEVYSLYIWMGVFGIVYYLGLLGFSMYRKLKNNNP